MAYPDIEIGIDGYCTLAHVEALNPLRTFNSSSKPTRVQVAMHINFAFNQMNGILDVLGYVVPVASGNATATRALRFVNALAAAASTEDSMYSAGNSTRSEHAESLYDRFEAEWKGFRAGEKNLIGAPRQGNYFHRDDERHSSHQFHVVANTQQTPTFTKAMDF